MKLLSLGKGVETSEASSEKQHSKMPHKYTKVVSQVSTGLLIWVKVIYSLIYGNCWLMGDQSMLTPELRQWIQVIRTDYHAKISLLMPDSISMQLNCVGDIYLQYVCFF